MKVFLDGPNFNEIKNIKNIDGYTFNPSLFKQLGAKNYINFVKKIIQLTKNKDISIEVIGDDYKSCLQQAVKISKISKFIRVKIPICYSNGKTTKLLIKELVNLNIPLNITAIFTIKQIEETIDALNNNVNSIISIFAGRIADTGVDPVPYIIKAKDLIGDNENMMTLWASTRQIYSIFEADKVGCDIITVPHEMLNKLDILGKNLEEYSLETVNQFYKDAISSNFNI